MTARSVPALVAQAGGLVVVQDPSEADQPSMPRSAMVAAPGAMAVPGRQLGAVVSGMLGETGLASWPARRKLADRPDVEPAARRQGGRTGLCNQRLHDTQISNGARQA